MIVAEKGVAVILPIGLPFEPVSIDAMADKSMSPAPLHYNWFN